MSEPQMELMPAADIAAFGSAAKASRASVSLRRVTIQSSREVAIAVVLRLSLGTVEFGPPRLKLGAGAVRGDRGKIPHRPKPAGGSGRPAAGVVRAERSRSSSPTRYGGKGFFPRPG